MRTGKDGTRTVAQVTWEITNLVKKKRMIEALRDVSNSMRLVEAIRSHISLRLLRQLSFLKWKKKTKSRRSQWRTSQQLQNETMRRERKFYDTTTF